MTTLGVPNTSHPSLFSTRPGTQVSVETIQLLGMESQLGGFWPGLRWLRCNIGWEITPSISLFLTPTITGLDLTLPRDSNRLLQPTLSLLTHTCRQLQSLTMNINTVDPLSGGEMGRLISTSQHTLRHITTKSFTPPGIFSAIFNLPRLQGLSLHKPHFPNQIPSKILPLLEVIDFSGDHGSNLTQFLGSLSVQRLASVSISWGETVQLSTLLGPLRGAITTMNMLYLSPVMALDHSGITLLCSFTNLTSLTIRCTCERREPSLSCNSRLTDEAILELGEALPHINTLSLAPGCDTPCHVTFASLVRLSRACSSLGYLSIRVDFTSIVGGSDQLNHNDPNLGVNGARPQRARSRLVSLTVGNSPLPDIPRCEWVVALALARIFPSIKFVYSWRTGEMQGRWNDVRKDILVCQKIFRITRAGGKRLDT